MSGARHHRQVRVRYQGQDARVDEGIAGLIRILWRLQIPTTSSCQGGPEDPLNPLASITFPACAASGFLDAVQADVLDMASDPLQRRISRIGDLHGDGDDPLYQPLDWDPQVDSATIPLAAYSCRCCWTWTACGRWGELDARLLFPPSDIPLLEERLSPLVPSRRR